VLPDVKELASSGLRCELRRSRSAGRREALRQFAAFECVDTQERLALVWTVSVSDVDGLGIFCRIELNRAHDGQAVPAADSVTVPLENQLRLLDFLCGHLPTVDFSGHPTP